MATLALPLRSRASDDDIDISGGCYEANLGVFGSHNEPPIARAAITLGYAAEIEANDETLRRYFRWIDLPTHAPEKHLGIKVIRTDQPLSPTLRPDAHQLDDRPEHGAMITYSQFRPVAKAAEMFGDRWTPLILRELCFGATADASGRGFPRLYVYDT